MALAPAEGWTSSTQAGSWPLPGEPLFAEPDAYLTLLQDLQRYCREEITGRSYLISGHRGAGKTTMVLQAIRQLRNKALADSVDDPGALLGRRGRPQRPLMVKIVGKSLISPPPPIPQMKEPATPEDTDNAARYGSTKAAWALVHITIALYRALAAEVSSAAALHAQAVLGPRARRLEEVAAQLSLVLDGEPDAAQLRAYWEMMGRLDRGLLWPFEAFRSGGWFERFDMLRRRSIGQGYREILAVATAAQAFQICSGRLTYERTEESKAAQEKKISISADFAALIRRVAALFAGAATGTAALIASPSNWEAALGGGVLVWLLGNIGFRFEETRRSERSQSLSMSFLRDRSIQTLDRELPLVIDRIRDAGLAPVFVVDELDKMKDTAKTMKDIIDRLKHLLADHGFFCFLTDRAYFDEVSRKVAAEAYPTEHTYYSRRVLVSQRPTKMVEHLKRLLGPPEDKLPITVFALVVAFRSKLNFADVGRALDYFISTDKNLKPKLKLEDDDLRSRRDLRLAATVQLAIDRVLRTKPFQSWFQNDPDPALVQLATDALYIIPRAWEAGAKGDDEWKVDISREELKKKLLERSGDSPAANVELPDLGMITSMVKLQADYLSNFELLRKHLKDEEDGAIYEDIVLSKGEIATDGLLSPATGDCYSFLLDENGFEPAATNDPKIKAAERDAFKDLANLMEAFEGLIDTVEVGLGDLATVGLLPGTIRRDTPLGETVRTLREVDETTVRHLRLQKAEADATTIKTALEKDGPWLGAVFAVLVRLKRDTAAAAAQPTRTDLLAAVTRHVPKPSSATGPPIAQELLPTVGDVPIPIPRDFAASATLNHFGAALADWRAADRPAA